MKHLLAILATALAIVLGICLLPAYQYIPRTLVHLLPGIDDYKIFYNRMVRAGDPHPWPVSSRYTTEPVPEALRQRVDELGTVAFVVIRNGELFYEHYREDYGPESLSNSFSMAKSIVSLLTGVALDRGYLTDVDQPVADFLPEFYGYEGQTLTLRHLLTMSAGLDWNEGYSGLLSPTTAAYYGSDLDALMKHTQLVKRAGEKMDYQSGVTQLIAMILEKATGESLSEFASQVLWTPLQAEQDALWCLDHKDGMEKAYCCFNSNARDFARFGQLILNDGVWNGKRILSADYIRDAVTPARDIQSQYDSLPNRFYGYQFWNLRYKGLDIPYMRGIYGQYVFIIPAWNAVVVRLGHQRSKTRTDQYYPDDIDIWLSAAEEILAKEQ